jgi:hypothetical protein
MLDVEQSWCQNILNRLTNLQRLGIVLNGMAGAPMLNAIPTIIQKLSNLTQLEALAVSIDDPAKYNCTQENQDSVLDFLNLFPKLVELQLRWRKSIIDDTPDDSSPLYYFWTGPNLRKVMVHLHLVQKGDVDLAIHHKGIQL